MIAVSLSAADALTASLSLFVSLDTGVPYCAMCNVHMHAAKC